MWAKYSLLTWFAILAQFLVVAVFVLPTYLFYDAISLRAAMLIMVGLATAVFLFTLGQKRPFTRRLGLALAVLGISFWGLGWVLMLLMVPTVGWWVFVTGWLLLATGLFLTGAAENEQNGKAGWSVLLLLAGLWPPLIELGQAHTFHTQFSPLHQLQIMFLFALGWVLQGIILHQSVAYEESSVAAIKLLQVSSYSVHE